MKARIAQILEFARPYLKREKILPLGLSVAFLGFIWFTIFGDQGLYQMHKSHKMKNELKKEITNLERKIESLKNEKALLSSPRHLETVIREELGYVKSGEVVFQQINP